jgi:hypothetical protein
MGRQITAMVKPSRRREDALVQSQYMQTLSSASLTVRLVQAPNHGVDFIIERNRPKPTVVLLQIG